MTEANRTKTEVARAGHEPGRSCGMPFPYSTVAPGAVVSASPAQGGFAGRRLLSGARTRCIAVHRPPAHGEKRMPILSLQLYVRLSNANFESILCI